MQNQITGLTVSDVSRLFQGKGVDKKKCNEKKKGLPVIVGASSLQSGGVEIKRWCEPKGNEVISKYGDILVSAQGTCGKVGINNIGDAIITDAIIAVRPMPWLMLPVVLCMWILYGIENQKVIPEFDEDTVGFQRCIKADVIGNIEIQPLDALKQIETVSAMTSIAQGFQHLEMKMTEQEKEDKPIESVEDVFAELKSLEKENQKNIRDLERMIKDDINGAKNLVENIQEELF